MPPRPVVPGPIARPVLSLADPEPP